VLQVAAILVEDGGKLYAQGERKFCAADIIDIIPSLPEVKVAHGIQSTGTR